MSELQAQILGNKFAALAREGAESFAMMSRSPLVIEEGQYACAILDAEGRLVAQDQGEPSQLAAVQSSVEYLLDAFAFNIAEGDVILTGDPYCGGTWGGVLTIAVPVFFDGDLRFITAIRFAAADLAGNIPGPFQPDAHEIWQEALRLTPVKLLKAGAPQKDVRQYIIRNTRATEILDSDLTTATVTATRIAERVEEMIDQRGLDLVASAARQRIEYSFNRAKAYFQKLPKDGQAKFEDISVSYNRKDDGLTVNFSGTVSAAEDASNLSWSSTLGTVLTQLAAEIIEDSGMSQGVLDAIKVECEEGSLLRPKFPAAVSLGWRITAPKVSEALAQAVGVEAVIYPASPSVVLFNEIGSNEVTQPVLLSPGYTYCAGFSGADAAAGRRRLVSVEETEAIGTVSIQKRQLTDGGIEAIVEISKEGLEGIVLPSSSEPVLEQDTPLERPRSNVMHVAKGCKITFTYPAVKGGADAEL